MFIKQDLEMGKQLDMDKNLTSNRKIQLQKIIFTENTADKERVLLQNIHKFIHFYM